MNTEIKICNSNKEFNQVYHDILDRYELEMQLFIRNLNEEKEINENQIRGGIYINNTLSLVFLNAIPFNLQLFILDDDLSSISINYLVNYINDNNITISGCQGKKEDCEKFINEYNKHNKENFVQKLSMDMMKLTKKDEVNDDIKQKIKETKCKLVQADYAYLDILKDYYRGFVLEAINDDIEDKIIMEKLIAFIDSKGLYVLLNENNELVSCVKASNLSLKQTVLSFVYTNKEYRGLGYTKIMIALVSQKYLQEREFVSLFVDKKNPISNKVYKDVGFKIIVENYDYRIMREEK